LLNNDEIIVCINGCKQNSRDSQKKIYTSFYGFAMSVCFKYAGNKDDAVEIVKDGFLKLFVGLQNYEATTFQCGSFVYGMAKKNNDKYSHRQI
jgi:RNA polymerase sigma-70 factor (ECF subfamily)